MPLGYRACQSLLNQGVKIVKFKSLAFLLKNVLIRLDFFFFSPNRILYYNFIITLNVDFKVYYILTHHCKKKKQLKNNKTRVLGFFQNSALNSFIALSSYCTVKQILLNELTCGKMNHKKGLFRVFVLLQNPMASFQRLIEDMGKSICLR